MEHALAEINESWEVLHCKTGDQVLKCQDNIDILFIHKHFDDGKTGSETIQRIRNQEVRGYRMLIVALWSEDAADIDNPGADFFWDNTAVAPTKMVEVLKAFVSSPKEMLVTCAGSKQHDAEGYAASNPLKDLLSPKEMAGLEAITWDTREVMSNATRGL